MFALLFILSWWTSLFLLVVVGAVIVGVLWFGKKRRKALALFLLVVFGALIVGDLLSGKPVLCDLAGRHYVDAKGICTRR